MSLDITLTAMRETEVYNGNITHNLAKMAEVAGIYSHLWRPDEIILDYAWQLIPPLEEGLSRLLSDPEKYKKYNPKNGWGRYESLVNFIKEYIQACKDNPDAKINISR